MVKVLRAIGIVLAVALLGTSAFCGVVGLATGLAGAHSPDGGLGLFFGVLCSAIAVFAGLVLWLLLRKPREAKRPANGPNLKEPWE